MLNDSQNQPKESRSFKKLLAVPHVVERKTQRPFNDSWFTQLLNRQTELHGQLSPYLLQLILEDLETRGFLTETQLRAWKNYKPKDLRRRKLANKRKRRRFDLSLPVELKWLNAALTKFSEQNGRINQANYVWNLLVQKELRGLVKALYGDDEKTRKQKYAQWSEEWIVHCSEFRRVGFEFFKNAKTTKAPTRKKVERAKPAQLAA